MSLQDMANTTLSCESTEASIPEEPSLVLKCRVTSHQIWETPRSQNDLQVIAKVYLSVFSCKVIPNRKCGGGCRSVFLFQAICV